MILYDEQLLHERLSSLEHVQRTAFATACAQRLASLFGRYTQVTGEGDPGVIDTVLERAWAAVSGTDLDLTVDQELVEAQMPDEEDGWVLETGYAQSAAACAAYALRSWLANDPQEAVWAARQVYDVADYAAQHRMADPYLNDPDAEERLLASPEVQSALVAMEADLAAVADARLDLAELRNRADEEGRAWSATLP